MNEVTTGRNVDPVLIDDLELASSGDAVFAPFNYTRTLPDESTTTWRALAYYHHADGKIVVNDVMFAPDLMLLLGPFMAPGARS